MRQLFIGFLTEGVTDIRFLKSVVENTLRNLAYEEYKSDLEIEVIPIELPEKGLKLQDKLITASKIGVDNFGMTLLCFQADSDDRKPDKAYNDRIRPAIKALQETNPKDYCHTVAPIVPVQETESWMLADKDLLKQEIGTDKSDIELGIERFPEDIADPKQTISNAISIARKNITKRRRKDLSIADLYLPIGQNLELKKLESLPSYLDFKENIRIAFQYLNVV